IQCVEGRTTFGPILGQLGLEEVVAPPVQVENGVGNWPPRGARVPHDRRDDLALLVVVEGQRPCLEALPQDVARPSADRWRGRERLRGRVLDRPGGLARGEPPPATLAPHRSLPTPR